MNSLAHVERTLAAFVAQPEPAVVALKGAWGAGKTYLWQHFIERHNKVAGCQAYSYVSLFGAGSLAELKRAIFSSHRPFGSGQNTGRVRRAISRTTTKLARHVEFELGGLGVKNTELWADAIEDRALREMIICLDDLERREEGITPSALLGFITNLRDERRCKVVLLYNEEKASEAADFSKALSEYREKAIDLEILLQPTVRDCYDLIFSQRDYGSDTSGTYSGNLFSDDTRSLIELFEEMGLDNIRVMQKTRATLDYFAQEIQSKFPVLWPSVARQIAKLSWLHYVHARTLSLDELISGDKWMEIFGPEKEGQEPQRKYDPVRRIAYHNQPIDKLIVAYLRTGFVDWATATSLLAQQEEEKRNAQLADEQQKLWQAAWGNFVAPEETVLSGFERFVTDNHAQMGMSDVYQVATFLARYQRGQHAQRMLEEKIAAFVAANADKDPFYLDLEHLPSGLRDILRRRLQQVEVKKPISEVIKMTTGVDGWNPTDVRFVRSHSEEDFYTWLTHEGAPRLIEKLKTFRRRTAAEEGGKEIVSRLDAALHRLAKRSKLDAERVSAVLGPKKGE